MKTFKDNITINHEKRFGRPCIRDTRISVYDILAWLSKGMSNEEILADFPELTLDDISTSLAFAADREHRLRVA